MEPPQTKKINYPNLSREYRQNTLWWETHTRGEINGAFYKDCNNPNNALFMGLPSSHLIYLSTDIAGFHSRERNINIYSDLMCACKDKICNRSSEKQPPCIIKDGCQPVLLAHIRNAL